MRITLLFFFLPPTAFSQLSGPILPVDAEAIMSVPQLIRFYGYPVEEHQVVTADGYILTLHRIPFGRNGFLFADAGYDVWMGNSRGNIYSKRHVRHNPDSEDFWRFSWQEMAQYDLQASIDGILLFTKQPYLYYVGHSQGTLTMFAKQATDAAFSTKIRKFFALAPVGRLAHVHGLFYYLGKMYDQIKALTALFGDSEFLPNNLLTRVLADLVCDAKLSSPLCTNLIFQVSGPDSKQFNETRIPIYMAHNPAGTSTKNILHFAQMVHFKRMAPYDYGQQANLKVYGSPFPPEYDLSAVSSPTYIFYSDSDWLSTPQDVEGFILKRFNSTVIKFARKLQDFNHNDFLWGLRAREEIYDPIANIIRQDVRRQEVRSDLLKKNALSQRIRKQSAASKKGISRQKNELKAIDEKSEEAKRTTNFPSSTSTDFQKLKILSTTSVPVEEFIPWKKTSIVVSDLFAFLSSSTIAPEPTQSLRTAPDPEDSQSPEVLRFFNFDSSESFPESPAVAEEELIVTPEPEIIIDTVVSHSHVPQLSEKQAKEKIVQEKLEELLGELGSSSGRVQEIVEITTSPPIAQDILIGQTTVPIFSSSASSIIKFTVTPKTISHVDVPQNSSDSLKQTSPVAQRGSDARQHKKKRKRVHRRKKSRVNKARPHIVDNEH